MTKRKPRVGDAVTVRASYCKWDGVDGKIVAVSEDPGNTMPYLVQRYNFDEWCFALGELELNSIDEVYG